MRRGPLISLLRLLAVIPAAFGSLAILPPPRTATSSSVPDHTLKNPPRLPAKINSLYSPATTPPPEQDTLLVADPDGTIYKVDRTTGKIIWSFSSGKAIYESYQALDFEVDEHNSSRKQNNFYVDCGDDWQLYVHSKGSRKVKLPFGAEELVRRAKPSAEGDMLGSIKTTIFHVDAKSGRVVSVTRSDDHEGKSAEQYPIVLMEDAEKWKQPTVLDFKPVDQLLYIKRTDYGVIYSSAGNVLWYLMVAEFEASYQCQSINNFLPGIESGPELEADAQLHEYCPSEPLVHRIRDHRVLESMFMADKLPKSVHGGEMFSLPAPDPLSNELTVKETHSQLVPYQPPKSPSVWEMGSVPAQPWVYQNDEARELAIYTEGRGMLSQQREDNSQTNISIPPESQSSFHVWLVGSFVATLLFIMALLLFCWNLVYRNQEQAKDVKVQSVTSKKKKARKSGSSRVSGSVEKRKENVVYNNTIGEMNGLQYAERTDIHTHLSFESGNGLFNGRKIGKLLVTEKEIAKGSNGTVVLEGIYDARPVAVKRLVKVHHDVALKEIQNLIISDQHPNIVRWYGVEYDLDFVYISLERCTCSLYDLILSHTKSSQNQIIIKDQVPSSETYATVEYQLKMEVLKDFIFWKPNGYPSPQLLKVMRDTVNGLVHLHQLGIVHRDLKPQNVLIRKDNAVSAKVSDMGISKRLSTDMSSLTKNSTGYGSSGWQAPEQLRHERQTRAVDLFSLGCLLFFCITGGRHPFGDMLERDINIVNDKKDLFLVENIPEALDLISRLLDPKPEFRPTAAEVLHHPLFWDPEMRLSFLRDASDRVELEDRENGSGLLKDLESIGTIALGGKWDEKLDNTFLSDIGRYRKYKYDSVRDLLRVIRNKLNHYRELPKEVQAVLGQVPTGFENYFNSRFPKLLMEVYKVLQKYCGKEEFLQKYFRNSLL